MPINIGEQFEFPGIPRFVKANYGWVTRNIGEEPLSFTPILIYCEMEGEEMGDEVGRRMPAIHSAELARWGIANPAWAFEEILDAYYEWDPENPGDAISRADAAVLWVFNQYGAEAFWDLWNEGLA